MRVAYITSHFPCGPGERFFEPEVQSLSELGLDMLIVPARPRRGSTPHAEIGLPVLVLPPFAFKTMFVALAETFSNPRGVARALGDVISSRYSTSAKYKNILLFPKAVATARELRRARVKHIHAQWLSTPSTVAYVASRITGIPWSCTAHQFDIFQGNLLEQKAASARFIRVISARNRDFVLQRAGTSHAARCEVVHLGVRVPMHVQGPSANRVLSILCAANLVKKKGHAYVLAALARLRDRGIPFQCDFAGDGPLRGAIESQIARDRLTERIRLRGVVAHDRLCAELSNGRYDLFVLASTEDRDEFEGIPVALMEAMAAGVPCVSTRTGSIHELIDDAGISRLVPQRDADALADAIAEFALDPRARADVGRRARERVKNEFETRSTSRQLFELIAASEART